MNSEGSRKSLKIRPGAIDVEGGQHQPNQTQVRSIEASYKIKGASKKQILEARAAWMQPMITLNEKTDSFDMDIPNA